MKIMLELEPGDAQGDLFTDKDGPIFFHGRGTMLHVMCNTEGGAPINSMSIQIYNASVAFESMDAPGKAAKEVRRRLLLVEDSGVASTDS